MSYSIGEVSEALNLSREMIRYYEKYGVLKLSRNSTTNYRNYEIMDIFWLLESLQYKSWGISIKDIQTIRSDNFHIHTADILSKYISSIDLDILKKTLLKERLEELTIQLRKSFYNLDNYWIQYIPSYYAFHLINGHGDQYDRINVKKEIRDIYFTGDTMAFLDNGMNWHNEYQEWVMQIEEKYVNVMHLPVIEGMEYVQGGLYVCTNVDIGEIGSFNLHADAGIRNYVKEKNLSCDDTLRAILVGRGKVDDSFRRIVEFRLRLNEDNT